MAPSSRSRRTSRSTARSIRPRAARTTPPRRSSWCRTAACRRTCRPTTPGSRSSTTTARSTRRDGSACRIPATAHHLTPPLVLNEPYGSDIANGMLYVADRDGGTTRNRAERRGHPPVQPADRRAGRRNPRRAIAVAQRHRGRRRRDDLRDADRCRRREAGSVDLAGLEDHARRRRVGLRPGRAASSAERHRLRPAGQHRRRQHRQQRGADVLARRQAVKTENAAQAGNDGLVIMPDGTNT